METKEQEEETGNGLFPATFRVSLSSAIKNEEAEKSREQGSRGCREGNGTLLKSMILDD